MTDTELVITRTFDARLERVWRAWTDPAELIHWFVPHGCRLIEPHFDMRSGGTYRCTFVSEDGTHHRLRGVVVEVVENERLVFTHGWADERGHVERDSRVSVTFEPLDEGTRVTLRQVGLATVSARDAHGEGWQSVLDHLAHRLEEVAR